MSSRDQEPPSSRVVSLVGCSGEGFLGHLVVGAPPKNGEDLEKTREGIPGWGRGRTKSWRLGWSPELGKWGAMKEAGGWERLMQQGDCTERQSAAEEP